MPKTTKADSAKWDKWTPVIFEDISGGVTREAVMEWAKSESSVLAVTREEADEEVNRPHYHCVVLYKEPVDRKTNNNRIRKYFPNMANGKTGMSCSQWDGSDQIYDYIYKGNKNDRSKGWDNVYLRAPVNIQFHHNRWHDEHLRITNGLRKKESLEERRERFVKEVVHDFKARKLTRIAVAEALFHKFQGRVAVNHLEPLIYHCLYLIDPAYAIQIFNEEIQLKWLAKG